MSEGTSTISEEEGMVEDSQIPVKEDELKHIIDDSKDTCMYECDPVLKRVDLLVCDNENLDIGIEQQTEILNNDSTARVKLFIFTERVLKGITKNLTFESGDFFYGIFITDNENSILKSELGQLKEMYSSTGQYTAFLKGVNMLKELNINNVKVYVKDKRFTKRLMQDSNYYKIRENKPLVEEIKIKIKDMKIKFSPIGKTLFKKSDRLTASVKEIWMKHIEDF